MSSGKAIIIDTPEGIAFFQLLARRGAVKLETKGLERKGRPAWKVSKEAYGLKGKNAAEVLAELEHLVSQASVQ